MSGSAESHRREAAEGADRVPIRCAVLTISDTRTAATDVSGPTAESILAEHGFETVERAIVRDEPEEIRGQLERWLGDPGVHVILTTGGTGIGRRDGTVEVVRDLLTTELDGFGELFRMISFQEIGAAAMLSRATAGLVAREAEAGGDTVVFAMPGSRDAVETALRRLIVPDLPHLVWQRRR
ncbi:MAG: MogA/MoaB family molybdenum cofactor biosynthesis protein [Planctomycetes bacterium]|nr:MogA/MoaB family molybdenum cofactor biosynthesis protein [Planctomycetota bacterium]